MGFNEVSGCDISLYATGEFNGPTVVKMRIAGRICKSQITDLAFSFDPLTCAFPVDYIPRIEAERQGIVKSSTNMQANLTVSQAHLVESIVE